MVRKRWERCKGYNIHLIMLHMIWQAWFWIRIVSFYLMQIAQDGPNWPKNGHLTKIHLILQQGGKMWKLGSSFIVNVVKFWKLVGYFCCLVHKNMSQIVGKLASFPRNKHFSSHDILQIFKEHSYLFRQNLQSTKSTKYHVSLCVYIINGMAIFLYKYRSNNLGQPMVI